MNLIRRFSSLLHRVPFLERFSTHSHPMPAVPEARMLRSLRRRMTLWYAGVLALALIFFGVTLYIGEERVLTVPIQDELVSNAEVIRDSWRANPGRPCSDTGNQTLYWACYSPALTLLVSSREAVDTPHMLSQSLARQAIRRGSATDMVDLGGDVGVMRRHALATYRRGSQSLLGVVEVGVRVQGELNALHLLLMLLVVLGIIVLLGGTLGGLFLSGRALVPVRQSIRRQQAFIADASHELRTPLSLIRADVDLLEQERNRLTPQGIMLLDDIVDEVTYMGTLAAKLLTLTGMNSAALDIDHDVFDLSKLASNIVRRAEAFAATSRIALSAESAGPVLVVADRVLLEEAALSLVDNGIKYTPPGGEVRLVARVAEARALLEVRDTGIGVSPEHLPHLGEAFYRAEKWRSRESGGAGLGLSIARAIVQAHGGTLTIGSTRGTGTTATLALPAVDAGDRALS